MSAEPTAAVEDYNRSARPPDGPRILTLADMNALRLPLLLLAIAWAMLTAPARADAITSLEYYNPGLDHYFVTASEVEIRALDNGEFKGWRL